MLFGLTSLPGVMEVGMAEVALGRFGNRRLDMGRPVGGWFVGVRLNRFA